MGGRVLPRLRAVWVAFAVLALATACGGGGGGGEAAPAPPVSGSPPPPAPTPPAPPPPGQVGRVNWLQDAVRVERDVFATGLQPAATASLAIQAPGVAYWFSYRYDANVARVSYNFRSADEGMDFSVNFETPATLAPGSYTDTLSVTLCYDQACSREVPGSPFTLPLRMDVGYLARAETGITPLVPAQTLVLNHDVRSAAYSSGLDAVVSVSALPEPMLRVHDLRTGSTRSLPLLTAPTSLALSADGLQAAVGHDAAVSLVNLREGAATPVKRMAVPVQVGSVVLAGTRIVAIGGQGFGWNAVYWVDTDSGTAVQAGPSLAIYGVNEPVLHPSGERFYLADRGLSPDDVRRMDLGGAAADARVVDSRYHGEHPFCGRVAVSNDGNRLYTGCGVVLTSSSTVADDMAYAGRMALSPRDATAPGEYIAAALSVAPDNTSIALLEENNYSCMSVIGRLSECHTRLAIHDATTLARRSLRGLAPYERGTDRLQQWGRKLMHRADGSLLLLAEVRTRGEATPTWLLHRLP